MHCIVCFQIRLHTWRDNVKANHERFPNFIHFDLQAFDAELGPGDGMSWWMYFLAHPLLD
jgi:hypothetical protein